MDTVGTGFLSINYCREVVPIISEVMPCTCTLQSVGGKQFVRSTEVVGYTQSVHYRTGSTVHMHAYIVYMQTHVLTCM